MSSFRRLDAHNINLTDQVTPSTSIVTFTNTSANNNATNTSDNKARNLIDILPSFETNVSNSSSSSTPTNTFQSMLLSKPVLEGLAFAKFKYPSIVQSIAIPLGKMGHGNESFFFFITKKIFFLNFHNFCIIKLTHHLSISIYKHTYIHTYARSYYSS